MSKVFVFGIDGAPPDLIFKEWLDELPTIKSLMENGVYGKLNSTIPPSTITAWSSMMSGRDTSEIGVFSFTYKDEKGETKIVDSGRVRCKRLWDILSEQDKRSIVLYVPLTYPVKPIKGTMVGDFLSLGIDKQSVYPVFWAEKIKKMEKPELFFDVAVGLARYKAIELPELLDNVYCMTRMQLSLAKDLLINESWDFFVSVMIGTDRLQHMFWRHFDPSHRRYLPDSPYKDSLKKYYIYLDQQLGEMIKLLPEGTSVVVVSDHGFVKQEGKVNLNYWLMQKGYLVLKEEFKEEALRNKTRFKFEMVDWLKSRAYGAGAYNGRLFLNKELLGQEYNSFREKLVRELKEIPDDSGKKMMTKVYRKEEIYKQPEHSECPDLTIYFDELRWASDPNLGPDGLYSWESAVGADNAGHSQQGIFIMAGEKIKKKGGLPNIDIRQVTPTILKLMGVETPKDIEIKPVSFDQDS